ncbi:MAG: cytochrome c [Epsilonproteobacteria bacterium]|nr:cytochrome c [Campylobacterota bacterium]
MKKIALLVVMFSLFCITNIEAAAYKGQRIYAKKCVSCHGKQKFIESKTKAQWQDVFKNNGKDLAYLHLQSEKAKASWKYFKSKKYTKKVHHLKDFLIEYAKDSGKVPACN